MSQKHEISTWCSHVVTLRSSHEEKKTVQNWTSNALIRTLLVTSALLTLTCHSCRADHSCAAWPPRPAACPPRCGTWRPRPRPPRGLSCVSRVPCTAPHWPGWSHPSHRSRPPGSGHPLSACAGPARTCTCPPGCSHSGAHWVHVFFDIWLWATLLFGKVRSCHWRYSVSKSKC